MRIEWQIGFWLGTLALFVALLYVLSGVMLPFVAALVLGYLLDPLADWLEAKGLEIASSATCSSCSFSFPFSWLCWCSCCRFWATNSRCLSPHCRNILRNYRALWPSRAVSSRKNSAGMACWPNSASAIPSSRMT